MRVLVTGGAGFLGSHLVDRLLANPAVDGVCVLDDLSSGRWENLESARRAGGARLRLRRGRVEDDPRLEALVGDVDVVFHLASPVGVERAARRPEATERSIAAAGRRLLAAVGPAGPRLVVCTSSEVYGFEGGRPFREDDVRRRIDGVAARLSYARGKLDLDRRTRRAWVLGLPVVAVRPFNVVGPRQDGVGGAVLPRFVEAALAGRPLPVHGRGTQRRTFLDVRDAADALAELGLAPRFARGWPASAVNLAGDEECSVIELARRVREVLGSRSPIRLLRPPESRGGVEIARRRADLSRLRRWISTRPRRGLDESIRALAAVLRPTAAGRTG